MSQIQVRRMTIKLNDYKTAFESPNQLYDFDKMKLNHSKTQNQFFTPQQNQFQTKVIKNSQNEQFGPKVFQNEYHLQIPQQNSSIKNHLIQIPKITKQEFNSKTPQLIKSPTNENSRNIPRAFSQEVFTYPESSLVQIKKNIQPKPEIEQKDNLKEINHFEQFIKSNLKEIKQNSNLKRKILDLFNLFQNKIEKSIQTDKFDDSELALKKQINQGQQKFDKLRQEYNQIFLHQNIREAETERLNEEISDLQKKLTQRDDQLTLLMNDMDIYKKALQEYSKVNQDYIFDNSKSLNENFNMLSSVSVIKKYGKKPSNQVNFSEISGIVSNLRSLSPNKNLNQTNKQKENIFQQQGNFVTSIPYLLSSQKKSKFENEFRTDLMPEYGQIKEEKEEQKNSVKRKTSLKELLIERVNGGITFQENKNSQETLTSPRNFMLESLKNVQSSVKEKGKIFENDPESNISLSFLNLKQQNFEETAEFH